MESTAIANGTRTAPRLPLPLFRLGDERLARLVRRGDERAFGLLYERYHQPLYRYLRSLLGQDADAQDALQSTFASAFGALRVGRRDAPLRPWLFRIAHNHAISAMRRRRPEDELTEVLTSPSPSPEEQVAERERLGQLMADLRELSDRQRGALVMRELSGLAHEDVACALEISVGAAKQSVFEARRALTEFAEGRAMACEEIQRVISDRDKRALRGRRVRAHLRSCAACAAFGVSIEARRADLRALSPALPAAAASALFARIAGAGFGHGGGGGAGGGVLGGVTGKTAGVVMSGKALSTGVAVLATAAVGTTGVIHQIDAGHGSYRSGTKLSIDRRSAAGASTRSGSVTVRLEPRSSASRPARMHLLTGRGAVGSAPLTSSAGAGAKHGLPPSATPAFSPSGGVVSHSNGAASNPRAHPVTGRSGSAGAPGSRGARGGGRATGLGHATHRASTPASSSRRASRPGSSSRRASTPGSSSRRASTPVSSSRGGSPGGSRRDRGVQVAPNLAAARALPQIKQAHSTP